jgi:hypothetical protein
VRNTSDVHRGTELVYLCPVSPRMEGPCDRDGDRKSSGDRSPLCVFEVVCLAVAVSSRPAIGGWLRSVRMRRDQDDGRCSFSHMFWKPFTREQMAQQTFVAILEDEVQARSNQHATELRKWIFSSGGFLAQNYEFHVSVRFMGSPRNSTTFCWFSNKRCSESDRWTFISLRNDLP